MSPQEIFDTVVKHLATMKERAGGNDEFGFHCRYRGCGGSKCAVGALLNDDEYRPDFEECSVDGIHLPDRLMPHVNLLSDLQIAHDHECNWDNGLNESGVKNLIQLAQKRGLATIEIAQSFPQHAWMLEAA